LNLTLTMTNNPPISSWAPGNDLTFVMNIYQNGILQVRVLNTAETYSRFRISDYGMGVEWSQLNLQTISETAGADYTISTQADGMTLTQNGAVSGQDQFEIKIQYSPFRVQQYSNGQLLTEINN
jgi:hypothetical protein